ncbi:MAG: UvrD-helicase domain-containing protein, partial [Bacteroidota bacterium]
MAAPESVRTFQIYKSSAGSGKTFTLVKEYLKIVLAAPDRYRNVLAITFTNKAAGEMKDRIIDELRALSLGEDGGMKAVLLEETAIEADEIQENAGRVLSLILHDYANFAVSTIDSFTYRLIRNFARDLDLPSKFDVETDTAALLARMVDQLMDTIGRDQYITEILIHFAEEKLKNESGWNVDRDISDVARELFKESSKTHVNALHSLEDENFIDFINFIRERKETYPEKVKVYAETAMALIQKGGLRVADFVGGKTRSPAKAFVKLQERAGPEDYKKLIESGSFMKAVTEDKWYGKRANVDSGTIEAVLSGGLRKVARELYEYHQEHYDAYLTAWHAYRNIHSLAVLKQIEDLMDLHKDQNSLVHISDFQAKISDFIRNETPDYIYWRLGERFRHYLLDEFQDTSLLQWLNLKPLFDYLQQEVEPGEDPQDGSLLLVGDSKQAIYRWRGGEVDLLEVVAPHELDVKPSILGRNYRSLEYVVDFNNRFFAKAREILQANPLIRLIYSDFEQSVRPGNEGRGMVQVALLDAARSDEFKAEALERTRTQILELRAQGYNLKDIAILVRTSKDGSEIAQFLSAEGIRVISADSILLHKEPVVNFIMSLFQFLVDPSHQIARAEVLNYFFHYLHSDTAFDIDPNARIRDILASEHTIQTVFEQLPKAFRQLSFKLDQLPLYELAEEIMQIFELKAIAPAYLQHFLDVILQYS